MLKLKLCMSVYITGNIGLIRRNADSDTDTRFKRRAILMKFSHICVELRAWSILKYCAMFYFQGYIVTHR